MLHNFDSKMLQWGSLSSKCRATLLRLLADISRRRDGPCPSLPKLRDGYRRHILIRAHADLSRRRDGPCLSLPKLRDGYRRLLRRFTDKYLHAEEYNR